MMKMLVASTNPGKVREIQAFLAGLPFEVETLAGHPGSPVYPEEGRTFQENARGKSLFYSRLSPELVLAEDSGLEVDRLGGAPGVHSARFSGEGATDEKNVDRVLGLLAGVPHDERKARFVCCMVLSRRETIVIEVLGTVEGLITMEKHGAGGFGYDPIFYYPPLVKTFAEMTPAEKNGVSHRGRALRQLRLFLQRSPL
jgi:XTP/dITP diphosphohydrolase